MSEIRIAARYAKSLIELSSEKGSLDAVYNDMQLITDAFANSRELVLAMQSPIIKSDKKLAILTAIFKARINNLTFSFFELLAKKNRGANFYDIAKAFLDQYQVLKGIQKAQVFTATKIDDVLRQQFMKMVEEKTGKKAEIEEFVKEELIGGYILRIGDLQYDASVQSKLQKIKKTFTENQYIPKN
ncbi:MAG: ATP synthase F1 subunit delta [Opitutaceae bacterium]|nr:ATP synthase F1 subunit delta [Cytophagales bacterium]